MSTINEAIKEAYDIDCRKNDVINALIEKGTYPELYDTEYIAERAEEFIGDGCGWEEAVDMAIDEGCDPDVISFIVYVPSVDKTIVFYEGTGDNLTSEDIEDGYDSYANTAIYEGRMTNENLTDIIKGDKYAIDDNDHVIDAGMFFYCADDIPKNATHKEYAEALAPYIVTDAFNGPLKFEILGAIEA